MATNTTGACIPVPTPLDMLQVYDRSVRRNKHTIVYFAASMGGLMLVIIMAHWINETQLMKPRKDGRTPKRIVFGRLIRSVLLTKVPFFGSIGFAAVWVTYGFLNLVLFLQNLDTKYFKAPTHRLGWLAVCNMGLVVFLGLKNTPLAFLTAYSYERINILHQAAGYLTIALALAHGISDLYFAFDGHLLRYVRMRDDAMGPVLGCCLLVILATAWFLKRIRYEIFYAVHIAMVIVILIAAGLHRPDLSYKSTYVIIFAAAIWVADRAFRASKIFFNFSGEATIYPLANGGVRVVMARTPWRAQPGAHIFLWIPKVRPFETHPFTMVSTAPVEIVISPKDGFTKELAALAKKNPGMKVKASADGPYGTIPNFHKFDNVVLIAGGSGATFAFGVIKRLMRSSASVKPMIHFIWVIRGNEMQEWFAKEIAECMAAPNITLDIYVTQRKMANDMIMATDTPRNETNMQMNVAEISRNMNNSAMDGQTLASSGSSISSLHKQVPEVENRVSEIQEINMAKEGMDVEKMSSGAEMQKSGLLPVTIGRPDLNDTLTGLVSRTGQHDKTIVAACASNGLIATTKYVVGDLIVNSGKNVQLHCEQFGW